MRYLPYGPELESVPNIVVDGRGNDASVLVLSHWPGSGTPPELKADTSTEIVLNYLRSPQREMYRQGAEAVSNNHYDIDGLTSIWAMLNPEAALEQAELLIAVGECGDFERWSGEQATKITCALNALEVAQSPSASGDYLARTAHLYQAMLPVLPDLLADVGRFEARWGEEFRQVERGRARFARGEATVQEAPELDLAVFELPEPLHEMALYEQTPCTRVALVLPGHRYEVRYRYESWVELQSRRPPPRIDLRPFADRLQAFEGNAGDWLADGVQEITPRLRLRGPEGEPAPSSLTPGLFLRLLAAYLREHASTPELQWSPERADGAYRD